MIAWWHLLWIIPLVFVAGSQLTSWRERKKNVNLNTYEKEILHDLWAKVTGTEKAVLGKIKGML